MFYGMKVFFGGQSFRLPDLLTHTQFVFSGFFRAFLKSFYFQIPRQIRDNSALQAN
jgi:hypothetical protein